MYAMTVKSNSTVGYLEDCKSTTERGAKSEAWRRFGQGYNGDVVEVSIKHKDGQYQPVSRKVIGVNTEWVPVI